MLCVMVVKIYRNSVFKYKVVEMEYKGIKTTHSKNNHLLMRLPDGEEVIVDCKKEMSDAQIKEFIDNYIKNNPDKFEG